MARRQQDLRQWRRAAKWVLLGLTAYGPSVFVGIQAASRLGF